MKRCKLISCWTDYPFEELRDIAGKKAPMRQVTVLSYDGDKYCKVFCNALVLEVKAGYLYSSPTKMEYKYKQWWPNPVNMRKIERMINTVCEYE